jgi:hypothetical protein
MAKFKPAPPKAAKGKSPLPSAGRNPFALKASLNRQSRKVLGKHYRTKFGVK